MEAYRQYLRFRPSGGAIPVEQQTRGPVESSPGDLEKSPRYVSFDDLDQANPQNWSIAYKGWVIALLSNLTLSLTFASSVSSAAEGGVMEEFGCGQIAATATTSTFLIGMGIGAMPAAPLSECES
jgi:DHA1 family multidrug resistance protein-like MFS transporter